MHDVQRVADLVHDLVRVVKPARRLHQAHAGGTIPSPASIPPALTSSSLNRPIASIAIIA